MADRLGRVRTRNFTCLVYPDSAPENWFPVRVFSRKTTYQTVALGSKKPRQVLGASLDAKRFIDSGMGIVASRVYRLPVRVFRHERVVGLRFVFINIIYLRHTHGFANS